VYILHVSLIRVDKGLFHSSSAGIYTSSGYVSVYSLCSSDRVRECVYTVDGDVISIGE